MKKNGGKKIKFRKPPVKGLSREYCFNNNFKKELNVLKTEICPAEEAVNSLIKLLVWKVS
jgi:hypothetical protein